MSTPQLIVLALVIIAGALAIWNLAAPRHGKLDAAILLLAIAVAVPLFLR